MNISEKGLSLIKSFEGYRDEAYQDSVGIWTIGWGTIKYPSGVPVRQHDTCNTDTATEFLMNDVKTFVEGLNRRIGGISLTQEQFDALVSFCYNLGLGSFDSSTLYKKLKVNPDDETIYKYNQKEPAGSCEFTKWIRAGGKVVNGLLRRRMIEADFYNSKT